MSLDRLRYEWQLAWQTMLLVPLLIVAVMATFAVLLHALGQNPAHALLALIEMLLPLAAGIGVATIIAQDSAVELQLTFPTAYASTALLRAELIMLATACIAALTSGVLGALGLLAAPTFTAHWNPLIPAMAWQFVWAGPLLWLCAVGICLGLLTRSRTASGTLLGGIWLLSSIFVGVIAQTVWLRPFLLFPATLFLFPASSVSQADVTTYWLVTRLWLLGIALALFALNGWLLRHSESILKGAIEA